MKYLAHQDPSQVLECWYWKSLRDYQVLSKYFHQGGGVIFLKNHKANNYVPGEPLGKDKGGEIPA